MSQEGFERKPLRRGRRNGRHGDGAAVCRQLDGRRHQLGHPQRSHGPDDARVSPFLDPSPAAARPAAQPHPPWRSRRQQQLAPVPHGPLLLDRRWEPSVQHHPYFSW